MTQVTAVGPGPVMFTTADGTQIEVPLWDIVFDNGRLSITGPHASSAELIEWLEYLASTGRISPGSAPARTAMQLVAATPGAYGNKISVTTSSVLPPTDPRRVGITVAVTDRYPDLTLDGLLHLDDLLGTSAKGGSKPGLLRVKGTIPADLTLPTAGDISASGTPPTWSIATGPANVDLVLEPANPGADFDKGTTTVALEPGNAGQAVTLVVTWSAEASNVRADDNVSKLNSFAFLVTVGGDPPPTKVTLPVDGTVELSGGSDEVDARPATASLLAMD